MGCNQSADDVDVSIIPGAPTISPVKASPVAEINKVVPVDDGLTKPILDAKAELQSTLDADEAKSKVGDAFLSAPFSLPEGWRVVCRLSRNDARARWGSRPRPAANSPATARGAAGASVAFEADLIAPELKQPLRLPLMLLPQWVDPKVGAQFMGRYEVRSIIPEKAGLERYGVRRGQRLEVFDQQDKTDCAIQVCDLERGSDVKAFAERLQLESLDSENKLFLRLRNMAIALPGRLAVVEDMPKKTLWQELSRIEPAGLAAKLACIANSVLEGLCRLHAHGWAHCGISPDTICLALDGCWKLNSLEFARKVRDLVPPVRVSTGTAVPPEVLLRLPVTEKVDVWQLAATLCEALMQKRIREEGAMAGVSQDGGNGVAENLCRLVDFLGPLPNNLVAQHPDREALFTPEGHVLRPASPDAAGQDLEAIEPTTSAEKSADSDPIPRPRLVVEALKDVEGGGDILEFLGRLLNPDPEQRPSAQEAKAHHFLRFAHTKQGGKGSAAQDPDRHAKIQDSHGDNAGHITRKGTGFVHVGELPPSDDEDEDEEEEAPKGGDHHVKIKDSHGDNAGHITRKGTGFVHMNELPPSDDEDEEEDEKPHHVSIKDSHGDNENKISRKGTGFVHIGELPPSDDEDEEEDAPAPAGDHHVKIQDSHGDCENKITRKGTGFVHIGELPPSDEEDEEEEEEKHHVQIKDSHGDNENKISRKGTGFVHIGELPPSDDEDEEEEANHHVQIQDSHGDNESKLQRKGTGFVHIGELPPSDDEDEEEEGEAKHAHIEDSHGDNENKLQRKGTGFVHVGELPPSDDEDEEEQPHHVQIQDSHGDCENKISRKGTGFVHIGELPPSDDEDEEDEEKGHVRIEDTGDHTNHISRKGTGFVHACDLDLDDEDDEDDDPKGVRFQANGGNAEAEKEKKDSDGKPMRKGTGFVSMSDLPDSDDEDED
mmetsp:Transcript_34725/g.61431  ORF Transcript_34725/g.61431 Transcript_34725/m.61431 type:complete len:942 (-) Transcript_34725:162-2987(-)